MKFGQIVFQLALKETCFFFSLKGWIYFALLPKSQLHLFTTPRNNWDIWKAGMVSALVKFMDESSIQKYCLSICSSFKQSLTALSTRRAGKKKMSEICPRKLLSVFFKYFRKNTHPFCPCPRTFALASSSAWIALPQHILLLLLTLFRGDPGSHLI